MFKITCGFCLLFLFACSFNSNTNNQGAKYLQGEWQQDNISYSTDLVENNRHQFIFTRDSFYLVLHNSSKANFGQDTCYKNGCWKEYVKGVYSLSGDTIILKGTYVSKTFRFKKSLCYTTGNFDQTLLYQSNKDSVLVLKSFTNGNMVFKLIRR